MAGAAILAIVAVDVVHTTLAEGAGPLTRRVTALLWSLARRLAPRRRFRHRALAAAGALTILTTIFCWFVLVWLGWGLILCAERDAVVTQADQTPAEWTERFYYTGFVMVTLTLEDHEPGEDFYKVITVLATANGFSILTLSLAYLLPVVQAATHKRTLALTVSTLGGTADEILLRAWDGRGFDTLTPYLRDLVSEINLLTERHQTYPVLHYFHPRQRDSAPAPMVAVLDEALTLLTRAVTPEHRPARAVHETLRRALTRYLTTLRIAYISPVDRTPPPPRLEPLAEAGIPLVDEAEWRRRLDEIEELRRLLFGLVVSDGWRWEDVCPPADEEDESDAEEHPARGAGGDGFKVSGDA